MSSAFPTLFPVDGRPGKPLWSFDAGFPPWDYQDELLQPIHSPNPVVSNSGSEARVRSPTWEPDAFQSSKPVMSGSGSDDPDQNQNPSPLNSPCGSDEPKPKREGSPVDERKRRRMISNRESARRSRMRKQKHLENLRNQVNRFRMENRNLSNRLRSFLYHSNRIQRENHQLRSEYQMLRHKLLEIGRILALRRLQHPATAWPCNSTTSQPIPPLIL